jgi:hypothetical protein
MYLIALSISWHRQSWTITLIRLYLDSDDRQNRPKDLIFDQSTSRILLLSDQTDTHSPCCRVGFSAVEQVSFFLSLVERLCVTLEIAVGMDVRCNFALEEGTGVWRVWEEFIESEDRLARARNDWRPR